MKFVACSIIFCLIFLIRPLCAQDVFVHVSNTSVYEFIDELANQQVISEINTSVKPYSRRQIAAWLKQADESRSLLNIRQLKELDFYLTDYNKELIRTKGAFKKRLDLLYYSDSLFNLTLNPVLGYQYWTNENQNFFHRWNGAEFFATIGPHIGIYGSLRDNFENYQLEKPGYLNMRTGAAYKENPFSPKGEYSESRGGITYSWKWGYTSIQKDHFIWGPNYHGANIFSGKTPSFPCLKLYMHPVKWLYFDYVHAFLVSDVLDTTRSYVAGVKNRSVFVQKFLAANMFTVEPVKNLQIGIGNSIVYSDEFQLGYLIPVYFFKSIDHTTSNTSGNFTGQNSQMYLTVSSRNIKYLHLYASVFIDEFSKERFNSDKASNFISLKLGGALSHPVLFNSTLIAEYTRTNPATYKHFVNTTTFESNHYNMGHYLRDNAEEIYFGIRCRPFRQFSLYASFTSARKGPDYDYLGTGGSGLGLQFISQTMWKQQSLSLLFRYEIVNDAFVFAGIESSHVSGNPDYTQAYTPSVWRGKTTTLTAGLNIGF
ncbi:MAG: hypothetical protein LC117_01555 [Bacteroidia bacterium]|nr:hypothetical protein [Bacteroidia bacterium]MCZ2276600.1 hypothetical protein [Bacteroidia bacterium]